MPRRAKVRTFRFRGLTVVHEPLPGPITGIALHVRAGARFDGTIPGLAHMAEHMLFQGTDELDQLALNRRAAELGGSHNATTGYESIAVTIETFNEDCDGAIELLMGQFYRSRVEPKRFRKECRVVLDEIRGFRDDPLDHLHERGWSAFFGAPIGHPICGTVGSVRAMDAGDVAGFLRRRFVNANAVLAVVGGVSEETLRKTLSRHVAADRVGKAVRAGSARRGRGGKLRLPGSERGQSFVVRFLEVDPAPRNLLALGVALDLVGADPDSTLFQAVREHLVAPHHRRRPAALGPRGLRARGPRPGSQEAALRLRHARRAPPRPRARARRLDRIGLPVHRGVRAHRRRPRRHGDP